MVRNKLYIVCVLFFSAICCGCNDTTRFYKEDLEKAVREFPDSLFSHFPKDVNGYYTLKASYPNTVRYKNQCGVFLVINMEKSSIDKLKEELLSNTIKRKSDDNSLLVVNLFDDEVSGKMFLEHYKEYFSPPYIVVPNFDKLLRSVKEVSFDNGGYLKGFDLYLLDMYKGKILNNEFHSLGWGLPTDWRNGYTRGVAINEMASTVIFWVEIW